MDTHETLDKALEEIDEHPLSEHIDYTDESYRHPTTSRVIIYGMDSANREPFGCRYVVVPRIEAGFSVDTDDDDTAEIASRTVLKPEAIQTPLDLAYEGANPRKVDEAVRREVETGERDAIRIDGEAPRESRERCINLAGRLHVTHYSMNFIDLLDGVDALTGAFLDRHPYLSPMTEGDRKGHDGEELGLPDSILPEDPANN